MLLSCALGNSLCGHCDPIGMRISGWWGTWIFWSLHWTFAVMAQLAGRLCLLSESRKGQMSSMAWGVDSQDLLYQKEEELPGRCLRTHLRLTTGKKSSPTVWLINHGQVVVDEGSVCVCVSQSVVANSL